MEIRRGQGRATVASAGTANRVTTTSTDITEVILTAETDNTGIIAVGGAGVIAALATRTGTPLLAGESIVLAEDNLTNIWIDSTVTGDGVTYQWVNKRE